MTAPTGAANIARLLAGRVDALARELLPAGHREGVEWRCGSVVGEPGHSLGVRLTGERAGLWCDFASGERGDALDLVGAVLRLDLAEAFAWSCRWLALPVADDRRGGSDTHHVALDRNSSDARADDPAARVARALGIWADGVPIDGTPAELYLRSRGLDPARLFSLNGPGCWPATLRYSEHAALDPTRPCRALIVALHGTDCGLVRAIHRVLLQADGSAVRDKHGRRCKLSLAPISGKAAMGDYWPDPEGRWGIAEGIESALAAYALTGIPTWAAISAGNMPHVAPPAWARHTTIFADRDPPGIEAAAKMMRRLRDRGIGSVRIVGAAVDGDDAADVLAGGGNA
jgi:putative DNA primase/helicase